MKIIREHFGAGPGFTVNAYVVANPLERIALRRHMRNKRHNLRPSHNWPGLRRHGASFILAAKGSPNVDRGPKPGYPVWLEKALKQQHSAIELWLVGLGGVMVQHVWYVGLALGVAGVAIPRLLERQRYKRWGQG